MARHRVGTVLKEFNIGLNTLRNFLHKRGITIDNSPNAVIDDFAYSLVKNEFISQKQIKEKSEPINFKGKTREYQIAEVLKKDACPVSKYRQMCQKLRLFAQRAIEKGGFPFLYLKDGIWHKKYKHFGEEAEDTKLKEKMLNGFYFKTPLTISFDGQVIKGLLWDNKIENIRIFSEKEIEQVREEWRFLRPKQKSKTKNNTNTKLSKTPRKKSKYKAAGYDTTRNSVWVIYTPMGNKR